MIGSLILIGLFLASCSIPWFVEEAKVIEEVAEVIEKKDVSN